MSTSGLTTARGDADWADIAARTVVWLQRLADDGPQQADKQAPRFGGRVSATGLVTSGAQQSNGSVESSADRAASVQQVVAATSGESADVKQKALEAAFPAPTRSAADIAWVILVCGLVVLLVLAALAITHVIGTGVSDDKVVTIFTTVLAGLLGLFTRPPGS